GWDWFSLHFDSGAKAMVFRLRDETVAPFFAGTWISADGKATPLESEDIRLQELKTTRVAGRRVPVRWRLAIESREIEIDTAPLNEKSWMSTSFPYWEGPIAFTGTHEGVGYLEMTGYEPRR
ncbi:MAG: lipocalin family protein, partial [Pseudomonadota bacterium]